MGPLTHPVVVLGVLSTALAVLIAGVTWQQRETRGARTYTVLVGTLAVWSTLYVGQLLVPTVAGKRPWFVARHAMSPLFAIAFWVFAAQYTDRREMLKRRLLVPIVTVGLGFVGLVLLNPGGLYWSALALDPLGPLLLLEFSLGPLFWLNCAYIFAVVAAAHVVIVSAWKRTFASYRPQLLVLTAVSSIEFVLSLLFLSDHTTLLPALNPWPNVQLITYGATLAAVPIGWSYVNDFFFDIQPLARQAVVDSMDDAVYIVDGEGIIRYTNPPGNRLLGRPPDAPTEHVSEAFAARPTLLSCYENSASGDSLGDDTILSCTLDGDQRFYDIRVSRITNSTGDDAGAVVVCRDITEERRQRGQLQVRTAQLERQNERLDQFGQYVSHDLRNPIQVASGYVDLARETGDLSRLDDIDRAIHRMSEMVEELRKLTAVDRDSLDVNRVNVARAAHTAWAHVDTAGATLRVPRNDIILADEDYLLHVFENLFRNSVEHGRPDEAGDAMGDGSGLTVTVGPLDNGFFVADDGVGIPDAERDAVLDHGYTTSEDGTGLGMSIVRTIADAHDWTVTVTESDAGGARFEFRNVENPDK